MEFFHVHRFLLSMGLPWSMFFPSECPLETTDFSFPQQALIVNSFLVSDEICFGTFDLLVFICLLEFSFILESVNKVCRIGAMWGGSERS